MSSIAVVALLLLLAGSGLLLRRRSRQNRAASSHPARRCTSCRRSSSGTANFCEDCGESLHASRSPIEQTPEWSSAPQPEPLQPRPVPLYEEERAQVHAALPIAGEGVEDALVQRFQEGQEQLLSIVHNAANRPSSACASDLTRVVFEYVERLLAHLLIGYGARSISFLQAIFPFHSVTDPEQSLPERLNATVRDSPGFLEHVAAFLPSAIGHDRKHDSRYATLAVEVISVLGRGVAEVDGEHTREILAKLDAHLGVQRQALQRAGLPTHASARDLEPVAVDYARYGEASMQIESDQNFVKEYLSEHLDAFRCASCGREAHKTSGCPTCGRRAAAPGEGECDPEMERNTTSADTSSGAHVGGVIAAGFIAGTIWPHPPSQDPDRQDMTEEAESSAREGTFMEGYDPEEELEELESWELEDECEFE